MLDSNQAASKPKRPLVLLKEKILLVEGTHEVSFFTRLVQVLNLSDIQVASVGGKTEFRSTLNILPKLDGEEKLRAIALVRDADDDYEAAFQSLQASLQAANYPVPTIPLEPAVQGQLRTYIFVAPDNCSRGALEDLCLASIEDTEIRACLDSYFSCLQVIQNEDHPRLSKAKVQAYLAKERTGDCSFSRASERDVWNWESPAFSAIKQFLRSL